MLLKNKDLFELLKKMSVPVAYKEFDEDIKLPCIAFYQNGSNNFGADNKVYKKNNTYNIELYTEYKDFELEQKLEDLLDENDIYWNKSNDLRIKEEKMNMVVYYI